MAEFTVIILEFLKELSSYMLQRRCKRWHLLL